VHLACIWIVSHLSAKNYRHLWKFDEVLAKTNLLSFFGTRCSITYLSIYLQYGLSLISTHGYIHGYPYHHHLFICQEHIQHNVQEEQIAYSRCDKAEVQH